MSTYNAIKYDFTPPAGTFGAMTLISEQTASASASISFTSGIDSTYRTYLFKFINIHPASDDTNFQFNGSTDGGSNYNVTKTTTAFWTAHSESGTGGSVVYDTANDQAQSTGYSNLFEGVGGDNDQSISGEMWLFNPSSTTYVKHFYSRFSVTQQSNLMRDRFYAGYFNTTSAVNAIDFKMNSGNIDAGIFQLYGIA